jgi:hypothetical protein
MIVVGVMLLGFKIQKEVIYGLEWLLEIGMMLSILVWYFRIRQIEIKCKQILI